MVAYGNLAAAIKSKKGYKRASVEQLYKADSEEFLKIVTAKNQDGDSPFIAAVRTGNYELVRFFFRKREGRYR